MEEAVCTEGASKGLTFRVRVGSQQYLEKEDVVCVTGSAPAL